ncbi:MAG: hypothetical protein IRZ20_03725 [Thermoleophilia bacterium]|nr:hypothetical protein [Thermoleophilia bacterium]
MTTMSRRGFTILGATLVALNLVLWLAPPGLALREGLINQLFGPRLIRAEVVVQGSTGTQDYLVDRGVVVGVTPGAVTLREQDGRVQSIPVATTTRVTPGRFGSVAQLRHNLRVLVFRQANAPAELIQVEGRGLLP